MGDVYKLYSVDTGITGTAAIMGIVDQSIDGGVNELIKASDGEEYVRWVGVQSARPAVRFSTVHIQQAMDVCGVSGTSINGARTAGATVFGFQKVTGFGGNDPTTGKKFSTASTYGFFIPRQLVAATGDDAVLSVEFLALSSDGVTNPFTVGAGCSETAQTGVTQIFTLGTAYINTTQLPGLRRATIDFGLDIQTHLHDGYIYPASVYRNATLPRISLELEDISALSNIDLDGSTGKITLFLRARTNHGGVAANNTQSHIKFEMSAAGCFTQRLSAAQGGIATMAVNCIGEYDGTHMPLIYTKSVKIEAPAS